MDQLKDFEDPKDTIQFKKDKLLCHIPLIEAMIAKMKGTEFQSKWETMLNCIVSDKKKMTIAQIYKLDSIIKARLSAEGEVKEKENSEEDSQAKLLHIPPKVVNPDPPKPDDLGKPILSNTDLQELIQDLSTTEKNPTVSTYIEPKLKENPAVEKQSELKSEAIKVEDQEKSKPIVRLPSSWIPSKSKTGNRTVMSPPVLAGQSLLNPYKIPKKSPSTVSSSSPQSDLHKIPPSLEQVKKSESIKLETINIFSGIEEKIVQRNGKRKSQVKNEETATNEENETSRNQSQQKIKTEAVNESEKQETSTKKTKTTSTLQESSVNEKKNNEEKESDCQIQNIAQPSIITNTKSKHDIRIEKEMRRLHENIVKSPVFMRRRSCVMKRASDLNSTESQQNTITKRPRHSLDAPALPSKKTPPAKPPATLRNDTKSPSLNKIPDIPVRTTRRSLQASKPKEYDGTSSLRKLLQEPTPTVPTTLAVKKVSEESKSKPELIKPNFGLKPCEINLVPDDMDSKPFKQTARKSTGGIGYVEAEKILKRPIHSRSILKQPIEETVNSSNTVEPDTPENDDEEWEDIDDPLSSEELFEEGSDRSGLHKLSKVGKQYYKTVYNIGFALSPKGTVYKCLINDCPYSTFEKHSFVKHLEIRHRPVSWDGFCRLCQKLVLSSKGGLSIMSEFIHMMEEHSTKGKMIDAPITHDKPLKVPVKDSSKECSKILQEPSKVSKKSSNLDSFDSESDSDFSKGLDLILDTLLPSKTENETKEGETQTTQAYNSATVHNSPLQAKTVSIDLFNPLTSSAKEETKVISKNIVGKVISLPPSILQAAKLMKKYPGATVPQPAAVTTGRNVLTSTSTVSTPTPTPEAIMKYVIPKPLSSVDEKKTQVGEKALTKTCFNSKATESKVDPMRFEEVLRPWLRIRTKKNQASTKVLTSPFALTATFKCLGKNCSFFTTDSGIFQSHLNIHKMFTPDDCENYMACAYCKFSAQEEPMALMNHIDHEHRFDKFQCSYCFYRSCCDFNVLTHQNNFHKLKPRCVLKIDNKNLLDFKLEMEMLKANRKKTVPPIICVFCRSSFYVFKTFLEHLKAHINMTLNIKCVKCGERTSRETLYRHLVDCHGLGLYQCVYCQFGSNTFEIISSHIANKHPSKLPVFCERSKNKAIEGRLTNALASSIESTTLKFMNQNVNAMFIRNAPNDEVKLKNERNKEHILCLDAGTQKPGRWVEKPFKVIAGNKNSFVNINNDMKVATPAAVKPLGLQIKNVYSLSKPSEQDLKRNDMQNESSQNHH